MRAEAKSALIREAFRAAFAGGVVVAASIIGQLATYPNLAPWYAGLVKPAFNPPNWVFAPAWTTLYLVMAVAVWRVLRLRIRTAERRFELNLFFAQLALNALWPWMFFAAHSPALGLLNIVPQLAVILATITVFRRLDQFAAWCLVPLAIWVSFATILNLAIWRMNA